MPLYRRHTSTLVQRGTFLQRRRRRVLTKAVVAPLTLANSAEGGTDGVTVTNANSGGASGNAFDTITGDGTVQFSNAHPATGSMGIRHNMPGVNATVTRWTEASVPTGQTAAWGRVYCYWTGWGSFTTCNFRTATGYFGYWAVNASELYITDSNDAGLDSVANDLSLNTLYRFEWHTTIGASGLMELRIYAGHSTTPLHTLSGTGDQIPGSGTLIHGVSLSTNDGVGGSALYTDDWGFSNVDWLGPTGTVGLEYINTAEGGTDEVAPTTGNSGGASGTAWSNVTTAGSALLVYDDDFDQSDAMGYRISSGSAANTTLRWDTSALPTTIYMRGCFAISGWPAANTLLMQARESDLTQGYAVRITTTGDIELINAASTIVTTLSATMPIDTWVKIEVRGTQGGAWEIRYYADPNSTTPDETLSGGSASFGTGGFADARFGTILGIGFFDDIWLDNLGISDYRYPVVTDNFPSAGPPAPHVMIQQLVLPLSFALVEEIALAPSVLTANGSNVDQTSYVTASISPTAPVLAFVDFSRNDSVQPVTPTLSGAKATWTQIGTDQYYKPSGSTSRISLAAFIGTGASTSEAVTIDFGGVTHSGCVWSFVDLVGGAASPVVQAAGTAGSIGTGASISAALASGTPGAGGNRCFAGASANSNVLTNVTERTNWTQLAETAQSSPSQHILTEWRSDVFEQTGSAVNNTGAGMLMGLIVVEIAN